MVIIICNVTLIIILIWILDIFKYYMQCKNVDDFEIDYQLKQVGHYLAQKIYDLRRAPSNKKMKGKNEKIKINKHTEKTESESGKY